MSRSPQQVAGAIGAVLQLPHFAPMLGFFAYAARKDLALHFVRSVVERGSRLTSADEVCVCVCVCV